MDDAARQADRIERQRADQERVRQLESLQRVHPPKESTPEAPGPADTAAKAACVKVDRISVRGVSLVPANELRRTVSVWERRCLGLAELNHLLEALTFLYVDRGYVASRAYLPEQDLSDGSLDIAVVEGNLESILLNGATDKSGQIGSAFPGLRGRAVNLRDIEQGLDQINRLRSRNATVALDAGKQPGASVLGVAIEEGRPWHLSLSSDNLGGAATGIYQSRADFDFDNLLGINDGWSFGYQRSMDRNPLLFSDGRPNSDTLTGAFSAPYGYWTFGIDGSWSSYRSALRAPGAPIDTSGHSASVAPYVSRVVHRDQISKTWLTGRLTWKETENFILGSRIDVSSRILSIATAELAHSRQLAGGQLNASLAFHRGLEAFGAFDDDSAPDGSPKGQFSKASFSLGYLRPYELGPLTALFNSTIAGQWSSDPLFGSEQMALGGFSTVRGTRESVLYSNRAAVWRNELSFLLPDGGPPAVQGLVGRLEPYVAIDLGRALGSGDGSSLGGSLVGAAVGLRNRGGRINFDISYSDFLSIDTPSSEPTRPGLVQARLSVAF